MQTERIRFNYKAVFDNISGTHDEKTLHMFRKNCDRCGNIKNTFDGDVYQFSFYCQNCCDTAERGDCDACGVRDVLKDKLCLICFNKHKTTLLKPSYIKKCMGTCSVCKYDNEYLVSVYGTRLCMQCCNNITACKSCGKTVLTVKGTCSKCAARKHEALKSNYYYPLLFHK